MHVAPVLEYLLLRLQPDEAAVQRQSGIAAGFVDGHRSRAAGRKSDGRGETPAYSWVPPGVDNYEPTRLSYAELTQDERNQLAQTLYAEAGYGPDNPLQLELRYNTSDTHRKIALAIQSMWREVLGFEVVLINEEFQVLLANIRDREITQVFRSSWTGDYNDAHTFLNILQSQNAANVPGLRERQSMTNCLSARRSRSTRHGAAYIWKRRSA